MQSKLGQMIEEDLEGFLPEGAKAWQRSIHITSGVEQPELATATAIVATISEVCEAINELLEVSPSALNESDVDAVVVTHESLLGGLLPVRDKNTQRLHIWSSYKKQVRAALIQISACLKKLLDSDIFSLTKAEEAHFALRQAEENLHAADERVRGELATGARVLLSTIGSSHKLPVEGDDDDHLGLSDASGRMNKKTIVIFDEAGCIPSYELLGLSRLGRLIEGLVCVGDKHQLPPYDPNSTKSISRKKGSKYTKKRKPTFQPDSSVESLLDVSKLTPEYGRIKLTSQYRVPRDIAALLNSRIYKGDYKTAERCRVPMKGFHFVDVPGDKRKDEKYVNRKEIECCVRLVRESAIDGFDSIMVLTPVSI
jgi:hypothetical protein